MEKKNGAATSRKNTVSERRASVHKTLETLKKKQHEFMAEHTDKPLLDMLLDLNLGLLELDNLDKLRQKLYYKFVASLLDDEEFLSLEIISHFSDDDGTHIFGLAEAVAYPNGCEDDKFTLWLALIISVSDGITVSLDLFRLYGVDSVKDSNYTGKSIGHMLDSLPTL